MMVSIALEVLAAHEAHSSMMIVEWSALKLSAQMMVSTDLITSPLYWTFQPNMKHAEAEF
eukprot:scaffold299591_cov22-Tisochrysis_lutea.AAC.1